MNKNKAEEKAIPPHIYRHIAWTFGPILKGVVFVSVPLAGITWVIESVFGDKIPYGDAGYLAAVLFAALVIFTTFQAFVNYYIDIEEAGLVIKKGWVATNYDTIYWVTIKDVESRQTIIESMFGCGSIILSTSIKNSSKDVKLDFIKNHQIYFNLIREKIGQQLIGARMVTFE